MALLVGVYTVSIYRSLWMLRTPVQVIGFLVFFEVFAFLFPSNWSHQILLFEEDVDKLTHLIDIIVLFCLNLTEIEAFG